MASLFRDRKSPFWFLKYKDARGKWRVKSLRLRHGIATETRKARAVRDEFSLEEHRRSPQRDAWDTWVPDYLKSRYTKPNNTRRRVLNAWDRMTEYFREQHIYAPQDLHYRHCMDYMPWRKQAAAHNTARLELKTLAVVCDEAIRRSIIAKNPAARLGIGRERGKERPELTDEHIETIRAALKAEPAWMSHAFEIALHLGCRLNETAVFVSDLNLAANKIHFRKTKGDKPFSVPLHPQIKPLFEKLLSVVSGDNTVRIFELPPNAARDFHRFFKKLAIDGVTFHCTRVTVASRLARAGYSMTKAMRLLNHSSELVHRSYQRLQAEDVADAYEVLRFPTASHPSETQERSDDTPSK